jgi:hypothetical protein
MVMEWTTICELFTLIYFFSTGKLFRSEDIPDFVRFFLMFYKDKPIDLLLEDIFLVKMCGKGENLVSISLP